MMLTREKGIYAHKGKGKNWRGKREKGKSTTDDFAEISLDQAPRARTYARTARHETISRLRGGPAGLTPQPPTLSARQAAAIGRSNEAHNIYTDKAN